MIILKNIFKRKINEYNNLNTSNIQSDVDFKPDSPSNSFNSNKITNIKQKYINKISFGSSIFNNYPPKKKLRIYFKIIYASSCFFVNIKNIKRYGTSSVIYGLKFKDEDYIKENLFLTKKNNENISKAQQLPFLMISHISIFFNIWNIIMFIFILYSVLVSLFDDIL